MTDIQITCGACGSMFDTVTLPDNPSLVYTCPSCEAEVDIDGNVIEQSARDQAQEAEA